MQTTKFGTVYCSCKAYLSIDASMGGAKIDRNLFGRFADNFGRHICGGSRGGTDSHRPNTRVIRNDVAALGELKVSSLHWPAAALPIRNTRTKGSALPTSALLL